MDPVCHTPFGFSAVGNYATPDLSRTPPRIPDVAAQGVPPGDEMYPGVGVPRPTPGATLANPRLPAGVAVRGPRPSINACLVFGFDASGSVRGATGSNARDAFGPDALAQPLTAEQRRSNMFGAQLVAVARALRDPIVQDYALQGPGGGIAVLPLQAGAHVEAFFSPDQRPDHSCEGWVILDTREKMNAYADRLLSLRRTIRGGTQIGEVFGAGTDVLASCPGSAQRYHVNVLVQDRDTEDGAPQHQVERASNSGVESHIVGVDLDPAEPMDRDQLTPYYRGVVGNHGRVDWLGNAEDYVGILRRQLAPQL